VVQYADMKSRFAIFVLCQLLLWPLGAAVAPKNSDKPAVPTIRTNNLAPLPAGQKPAISHSAFEDGDCSICHQNKDAKNPGPLKGPVNALCMDCHDDIEKLMSLKFSHNAAKESCVSCHNPHNSKLKKLLVEETETLCLSCHEDIKKLASQSKVKHQALEEGAKCANCHNPHAAKIEHLLIAKPYDLCVTCHGKDGVQDRDGKKLTNMKTLLADNPEWHGPVADKDCSACHNPHGGENFRLLNHEYPAEFYSAYDPKKYGLCFDCHEESMVASASTTTLTQFRNGATNLHFLHVNKAERGRTCRACHEVHAAKQKHQIRDGVPYGSKGWILRINYTRTSYGGSCEKTCHEARSYTNSAASLTVKSAAPDVNALVPPAKKTDSTTGENVPDAKAAPTEARK